MDKQSDFIPKVIIISAVEADRIIPLATWLIITYKVEILTYKLEMANHYL